MRQRLTVQEKLDELLRTDPISTLRQVSGGVLCELLLRDGWTQARYGRSGGP